MRLRQWSTFVSMYCIKCNFINLFAFLFHKMLVRTVCYRNVSVIILLALNWSLIYYLFTTTELVSQVAPQRYKIISLLVLPLLWQLLSSCAGSTGLSQSSPIHKSTCHLANEVKLVLGDGLMDAACINSKVTLGMRESLAGMLVQWWCLFCVRNLWWFCWWWLGWGYWWFFLMIFGRLSV